MGRLDTVKGFAMPEAIGYGAQFGDLKDGDVREALKKYYGSKSVPSKTSALAYWFTHGSKNDVAVLQPFEDDKTKIPQCPTAESDPDCKWSCEVQKEGSKDPKERENKDITTVGEFVRFCILPTVRNAEPKK